MPDSNNTIEQLLNESPLLIFSFYTHIQVQMLIEMGERIVETLDTALIKDAIDGEAVNRVLSADFASVRSASYPRKVDTFL